MTKTKKPDESRKTPPSIPVVSKSNKSKKNTIRDNPDQLYYNYCHNCYSQNPALNSFTPKNAQFHTESPSLWVEVLKTYLVDYEPHTEPTGERIKTEEVSFFIYHNGTVLIQGPNFARWLEVHFEITLDAVNQRLQIRNCATSAEIISVHEQAMSSKNQPTQKKANKTVSSSNIIDTSEKITQEQTLSETMSQQPRRGRSTLKKSDNSRSTKSDERQEEIDSEVAGSPPIVSEHITATTSPQPQTDLQEKEATPNPNESISERAAELPSGQQADEAEKDDVQSTRPPTTEQTSSSQTQFVTALKHMEKSFVKAVKVQQEELINALKDQTFSEIECLHQQIQTLHKLHKEEQDNKERVCSVLQSKLDVLEENAAKYQDNINTINSLKADNIQLRKNTNELLNENESVQQQLSEITAHRDSLNEALISERLTTEKHYANLNKLRDTMDELRQDKGILLEEITELKKSLAEMENKKQIPQADQANTENQNIIKFKGESDPLSNLYPSPLTLFGHNFTSAEAAYQWRKAMHYEKFGIAADIQAAPNGRSAMNISTSIETEKTWEEKKLSVMKEVLTEKIKQCTQYQDALRKTGSSKIAEDTRNQFWGISGQNHLGKLHEGLRLTLPQQTYAQVTGTGGRNGILIIGNSITNNLDKEVPNSSRKEAPTVKEATKIVDSMQHTDITVLQGLTNEIRLGNSSPNQIADMYVQLAKKAAVKSRTVIMSMGTPQWDRQNNDKILHTNQIIFNRIKRSNASNVRCWFHNNLLEPNGAARGDVLARDGYHLNSNGKKIYIYNIKHAIDKFIHFNN